jgi:lysyl-tRNA synthetase class 1
LTVRRDGLPKEAAALDATQRQFLAALARVVVAKQPTGGDGWQDAIFTTATEAGLEPKAAFAALYLAFLGRSNGPRAGWLLASLEPEFVIGRLREAAAGERAGAGAQA